MRAYLKFLDTWRSYNRRRGILVVNLKREGGLLYWVWGNKCAFRDSYESALSAFLELDASWEDLPILEKEMVHPNTSLFALADLKLPFEEYPLQ